MWISKQEYDETGKAMLDKKCLWFFFAGFNLIKYVSHVICYYYVVVDDLVTVLYFIRTYNKC